MVAGFNFPMTDSPGPNGLRALSKHEIFTGWVWALRVCWPESLMGLATVLAGRLRVNSICLVQYEKNSRGFCAIHGMKQDFQ